MSGGHRKQQSLDAYIEQMEQVSQGNYGKDATAEKHEFDNITPSFDQMNQRNFGKTPSIDIIKINNTKLDNTQIKKEPMLTDNAFNIMEEVSDPYDHKASKAGTEFPTPPPFPSPLSRD